MTGVGVINNSLFCTKFTVSSQTSEMAENKIKKSDCLFWNNSAKPPNQNKTNKTNLAVSSLLNVLIPQLNVKV